MLTCALSWIVLGYISVLYSRNMQEIRKSTTLVLCQKFDVKNMDKSTHKFGLSLVIE